jgi:hypothetical protein
MPIRMIRTGMVILKIESSLESWGFTVIKQGV